jgi:phosphomannomutase / phosphoglucomutase
VRFFGTNGIREVVGPSLTPAFATAFASAVGRITPRGGPIAVGWDGRTSSVPLARIVSSTLALHGHGVVELGLLPTPAIQYSVPRVGAQLGVIITASHNPPEFNGFKCIAADGLEVPRSVEEAIEAAMAEAAAPSARFDGLGEVRADAFGASRYIEAILDHVDRSRIAARHFSVVLDCANGASAVTSPELLRRLGCRVISLNGHIDGTFPGRPSEPTEANLTQLAKTVPAVGAELGIAHDGDADRAIFIDASGRFVPGERILAWIARDRVRRAKGGVVVTPVTGSLAVDAVVKPLGGQVVYTRVGSPTVTHAMQERSAIFGGEENGGLIFPELQLARDGAMTAAAVLDLLAQDGRGLAEVLADLPQYYMVKLKVECPANAREAVLERLAARWKERPGELVTIDGLKSMGPDGWILLRPSGTESLIRIFAESTEPGRAHALAEEGKRAVESMLGEVARARR